MPPRRTPGEPHVCPQCKVSKLLTTENFAQRKNGRFDSWCRDCKNEKRQQYRSGGNGTAGRRTAIPCIVRVVQATDGTRRALYYFEDGPGPGEVWIGVGSHLLDWCEDSA